MILIAIWLLAHSVKFECAASRYLRRKGWSDDDMEDAAMNVYSALWDANTSLKKVGIYRWLVKPQIGERAPHWRDAVGSTIGIFKLLKLSAKDRGFSHAYFLPEWYERD